MIPLDAALAIVTEVLEGASTACETALLAAALGRVVADDVRAPRDIPGFRHSAMDGYAVRGSELAGAAAVELEIAQTILAGASEIAAWRPGAAARIMTGAPMPDGADTVVIKEHATLRDGRVVLLPGTGPGANVRPADDDYAAGALAVPAGTLLGASEIGIAAAFGLTELKVRARPRVAVLVTGDELVSPPQSLQFGQRYDSNGAMLAALLAGEGAQVVALESVRDDPEAIGARLLALARGAELVITSGGVSAGDADHLPRVIERHGRIHFWKVRMRPGMPVLFGDMDGTPVFSLPGNPVSVFATFLMLVRPALYRLRGAEPPAHAWYARLTTPVDKAHDRVEFRRGRLLPQADGTLAVALHSSLSSGALSSVVESDALAELAAAPKSYQAGDVVPVHRLRS